MIKRTWRQSTKLWSLLLIIRPIILLINIITLCLLVRKWTWDVILLRMLKITSLWVLFSTTIGKDLFWNIRILLSEVVLELMDFVSLIMSIVLISMLLIRWTISRVLLEILTITNLRYIWWSNSIYLWLNDLVIISLRVFISWWRVYILDLLWLYIWSKCSLLKCLMINNWVLSCRL